VQHFATQAFATDVRVWPLLGRAIVMALGQLLIVPAPWAVTSFYRWFVEHLHVPGHQRVAFAGQPGDIW
jgi:nitric oxide reductase large subunit